MARGRMRVRPPKPTGRRRALELCKDVLIVVLVCSAIYLAGRSQPYLGLGSGIFSTATRLLGMDGGSSDPVAPVQPADTLRPVAMAFCTGVDLGDGTRERCALQYDQSGVDKAFNDTVRRFLAEAMASAGTPAQVDRKAWEQALQSPGIYCDFAGHIPLDALAVWLGEAGAGSSLTGSARRLVLADRGESSAVLYYINEDDGLYYACTTSVRVSGSFTEMLMEHSPNGARFVFEAGESYAGLAPDMLLLAETPSPAVYQASSPISLEDAEQLNRLQSLLSFRPAGYETLDGWVNDTLRIGQDGRVSYEARQTDEQRYPVAESEGRPDLVQACDTAWALLESALSAGQNESAARVCLLGVEELEDGTWLLSFGYTVSGALIEVEGSLTAGQFLVEEGRICAYEFVLRQYQDSGERTALLPEAQAAAAMDSLGQSGQELVLCYFDQGGEAQTVQAGWAAL